MFCWFFEKLETRKKFSEIYWPLLILLSLSLANSDLNHEEKESVLQQNQVPAASFRIHRCVKSILALKNLSRPTKSRNGILFPKLFWPTVRKNCSSDWEKRLNSRLKAENLQIFLDHLNNLFKQWKVRTIFGNRMLF